MDNKEFKEMMEQGLKRDAARREKLLAAIKKRYPTLQLEGLKTGGDLYGDFYVLLNNRVKIITDGFITCEIPTELGWRIKFVDDLDRTCDVVEVGYKTYVIESFVDWAVYVYEYFTESGTQLKGKRRRRTVHESSKGKYVGLNGKRHYVSFLNNKEGGN